MVGVVTDATRMRVTKADWAALLVTLGGIVGRTVVEVHSKDLYRGSEEWNGVPPDQRMGVFLAVLRWLIERKHNIVVAAVDVDRFENGFAAEPFAADIATLWRFLALHLSLSIQKAAQRQAFNKGNTVLVFDNNEMERRGFTNLLLAPPAWTDTYYRSDGQDAFDQLIDVPHFVDSHKVGLVQLADCLSFVLRNHLELSEGKRQPKYQGEVQRLSEWADLVLGQCISWVNIYPKKGRCQAADLFYRYSPLSLRDRG